MKKTVVEKINIDEPKKAKNGKDYYKAGIRVEGKWYNNIFWESDIKIIKGWEPGKSYYIEFYEKEHEGKIYDQFKLPNKFDLIIMKLDAIEKLLTTDKLEDVKLEEPPSDDDLPFEL